MDPVLIGVVIFITLLLLAIGYWQREISKVREQRLADNLRESEERGTNQAVAQFPEIDEQACIGCGSCVRVCPEKGVLGMVDGVAKLIHANHCVGHGLCADVCPVAAITIGLGDISLRSDIPVLSDDFETSVPGIYMAGELGGIALIKNAVEQGVRVVDHIADWIAENPRQDGPDVADVLIVGCGPAGLAATLKARERRLRYVTINQDDVGGTVRKYPRRKLVLMQPVELPLYGTMGKKEYVKEELIDLWDAIIQKYKLEIHSGVKLLGTERSSDGPLVASTSAGEIVARTVVLALGRRGTPRKLDVPGEESEKVVYQLIDAATYVGQRLLVVGGGDSAVEAATALAEQQQNDVTLSYRRTAFFRLKARNEQRIADYQRRGKVRVLFSSHVQSIEPESVTLRVVAGGSEKVGTLDNDYVFVLAGGEPPYPLLKNIGVRFGGDERAFEAAPGMVAAANR